MFALHIKIISACTRNIDNAKFRQIKKISIVIRNYACLEYKYVIFLHLIEIEIIFTKYDYWNRTLVVQKIGFEKCANNS